jgi:hypothetical protein
MPLNPPDASAYRAGAPCGDRKALSVPAKIVGHCAGGWVTSRGLFFDRFKADRFQVARYKAIE